jgi:hypothetical protein
MYGLPRWGQTANTGSGSTDLEWKKMVTPLHDHD